MKGSYKDSHIRSAVKAISWRFLATLTTIALVFAFTREFTLSLQIGVFEVVIKLLVYYLHERAWQWIPLGRKAAPMLEVEMEEERIDRAKNKLRELGYIE